MAPFLRWPSLWMKNKINSSKFFNNKNKKCVQKVKIQNKAEAMHLELRC